MKLTSAALAAIVSACIVAPLSAQVKERPIPRVVKRDGRFALMVDDAPYLMLGAQSHNSSAWPATLAKVWPAMEYLHVNTLETPVYWEQFEPQPGHYDYTLIDALLAGAAAQSAPGAAVVRHLEERQPALHADWSGIGQHWGCRGRRRRWNSALTPALWRGGSEEIGNQKANS
jgi:hypothetical protein